ncbi:MULTISPECIES: hypothetical protein [Streptomyces]|uniref:Uncharacterized protein n=1 Tax=Streptomyces koelreuteriae TaxID=2838015 RepID=A0ABX8FWE9_9ACTN|nr:MULTISPECIES: hypothetical protein [Streptomyces]QWB25322.1 hypothetical protein KJK29_23675 [Streptomyces koelreuteriae]UUA08364.1 hypothetical protein NNW98_23820 [Streptomyces koelreuteriae]UUA15970.1 hypothetical protein NNW99_23705 [Streptomyces sp. CRCS-T-1]
MAAVIGAAIGTLGGVGGGLVTAMSQGFHQRRQRQIDREHNLEQARRDAYSTCISTSKQVSAAWWKLAATLRLDGSTEEQWREPATGAHAAWAPFSSAAAEVAVVGPAFVADAADVLRRAMYDLDMAGTAWHEAALQAGTGRLEAFDARYMRAVEAKRAPGSAFQAAARRALLAEN